MIILFIRRLGKFHKKNEKTYSNGLGGHIGTKTLPHASRRIDELTCKTIVTAF